MNGRKANQTYCRRATKEEGIDQEGKMCRPSALFDRQEEKLLSWAYALVGDWTMNKQFQCSVISITWAMGMRGE